MDAFNYLTVLLSIILGLAITQLLKGLRALILYRPSTTLYWPSLWWAAFVLLVCVQGWWAMFGMREVRVWTFGAFGVVLLQTVLTYLVAALVFPDFGPHRVDLREHFLRHAGAFFGLLAAAVLASAAKEWVLSGHWPQGMNLAFHGAFFVMSVLGASLRRPALHAVLPLVALALMGAYVAFLFATLR
jgi:hypothetical protein